MIQAGVALDVDGTAADTVRENYNRMVETWIALHGRRYPIPFAIFRDVIRPEMTRVEDYFSATFAILDNDMTIPGDLPQLAKTYRRDEALGHLDMFYRTRESRKAKDMPGWLAEQSLYPGVPEMLRQLDDMGIGMWVVSSKDGKTVRDLWVFNNLPDFRGIYDKDSGKRPEQFKSFLQDTNIPPSMVVVYDDMGENLAIAANLGMLPVAAPQGYDLSERVDAYRQSLPLDFPGVVKELLDI